MVSSRGSDLTPKLDQLFVFRAFLCATCAMSLLLPAMSQELTTENASIPANVNKQPQWPALQGGAKQEVHATSPLEGKLEQTAPLQSGLSEEEVRLHSMNGSLDQSGLLQGGADRNGESTKLQGRLEQIGEPDPSLPVELTTKATKNQPMADIKLVKLTPKLDTSGKSTLLKGGLTSLSALASFPDFVVGTWGGHLKLLSRKIVKGDIADAHLLVNELGTVVVRFMKNDQNVSAVPATIFFKSRPLDRLHHMMRREPALDTKEDLSLNVYNDYPVIDLGTKRWHNAVGTQWQDEVLHNSLQRIGTNGAEQDIVFQRTKDGALYGYRETVARFTWVSKTSIFMQVAVADYTPDRKLRKRTTLEGNISQVWHPYAEEISSITSRPWEKVVKLFDLNIDW